MTVTEEEPPPPYTPCAYDFNTTTTSSRCDESSTEETLYIHAPEYQMTTSFAWESLPVEIEYTILDLLHWTDLGSCSRVCRRWRNYLVPTAFKQKCYIPCLVKSNVDGYTEPSSPVSIPSYIYAPFNPPPPHPYPQPDITPQQPQLQPDVKIGTIQVHKLLKSGGLGFFLKLRRTDQPLDFRSGLFLRTDRYPEYHGFTGTPVRLCCDKVVHSIPKRTTCPLCIIPWIRLSHPEYLNDNLFNPPDALSALSGNVTSVHRFISLISFVQGSSGTACEWKLREFLRWVTDEYNEESRYNVFVELTPMKDFNIKVRKAYGHMECVIGEELEAMVREQCQLRMR